MKWNSRWTWYNNEMFESSMLASALENTSCGLGLSFLHDLFFLLLFLRARCQIKDVRLKIFLFCKHSNTSATAFFIVWFQRYEKYITNFKLKHYKSKLPCAKTLKLSWISLTLDLKDFNFVLVEWSMEFLQLLLRFTLNGICTRNDFW